MTNRLSNAAIILAVDYDDGIGRVCPNLFSGIRSPSVYAEDIH